MELSVIDSLLPTLDLSMVFGGILATLVFGFLAFQDRLVSLLVGTENVELDELVEES